MCLSSSIHPCSVLLASALVWSRHHLSFGNFACSFTSWACFWPTPPGHWILAQKDSLLNTLWLPSSPEFINGNTTDILDLIVLCNKDCLVHYRTLSNTLCLYPVVANWVFPFPQLWQPRKCPQPFPKVPEEQNHLLLGIKKDLAPCYWKCGPKPAILALSKSSWEVGSPRPYPTQPHQCLHFNRMPRI